MSDQFNLARFVEAQEPIYDRVISELAAGRKRSHWMWFVFPQLSGLGRSEMAARYAISSRDEASAYLSHDILGSRLIECTELMLAVEDRNANEILGSTDDLKFRSSMTLFRAVSDNPTFDRALRRFYAGEPDPRTLELLEKDAQNRDAT